MKDELANGLAKFPIKKNSFTIVHVNFLNDGDVAILPG
jgi:hypothetical protein